MCHLDTASLPSTVSTSLSTQTVFALPLSRLLPRIRLRTRQAPALVGQKILVTIDRWDAHSRYPEGHLVRALGKAEDKETEQESLLLEFEVPYRPFGKAILDCLPPERDQWVVPPKDPTDPVWRDRMDLRELDICSIDPPGACLSVRSFECVHMMRVLQDVRISTTPCMRAVFPMGILKRASVSTLEWRLSTNLTVTPRHCGCVPFRARGYRHG